MAMSVTSRCSRVGAHALRLAADPIGTYRAGSLLLHGSPSLAAWLAGWVSSEFPLHVVTGYALSAVPVPAVERIASGLAAQRADEVLGDALRDTFGDEYAGMVRHPITTQAARRPSPAGLMQAARHRRRYAAHTTDIAYGPGGRNNLLDVWRHPDLPVGRGAPVLVQVPGGGWVINDKRGQAYPLMSRMVELGWICVSINYSKSPRDAWPAHIVDVKRAIAWVRSNIADYGGDPDFVAVTGGSAGAHLCSLAALTPNDPALQPGFEDIDTTVQAAVPFYGVYDLTNVDNMHELMLRFLEQFVMQARLADDRRLFESASPIFHAHRAAPPFFVLHGRNDSAIPRTQAHSFCAALREAGADTVCYAELPNAHHAFDTVATVRSQLVADAVAEFLGIVYGQHDRSAVGSLRARRLRPAELGAG
jgi:acetyl esterase/lipase